MSYQETFVDSTKKSKVLSLRFHREARSRYRAPSVEALESDDFQLLLNFIRHFEDIQRPRLQELLDYAEGNNHTVNTGKRRKDEDMADNRSVHNYGKLISSFKQGYLVGEPIKVMYDDGDEDSDNDRFLRQLGKVNSFDELNRALVLDLSRVGRAFEIVYRTSNDVTRVKRLDPRETFVIYSNDLEENVIAAVRVYSSSLFEEKRKFVELYTSDKIQHFFYDGELEKSGEFFHAFHSVPIVEYLNNSDGLGDYESELDLIDLYDAAQSDTANYMQDLSDAILAIFGRVSFPESVQTAEQQLEYMRKMRKARLLNLEPPVDAEGNEGSVSAQYLYKQYDVTALRLIKVVW